MYRVLQTAYEEHRVHDNRDGHNYEVAQNCSFFVLHEWLNNYLYYAEAKICTIDSRLVFKLGTSLLQKLSIIELRIRLRKKPMTFDQQLGSFHLHVLHPPQ